jgi:hypothetical protein
VPPPPTLDADRSLVRWATPLVFLAALVYFLLFHRYGFFVQDEGVNAYQALRVLEGQVPYADFQTAYTPAGYYIHAALFRLFGTDLSVLRVASSFACAGTATLLFRAAVHVLPGPWTLLPSFLYVLLEDQESRGFVVHTIAYPARYISTLWVLSLCLTLAHVRRPRWWLTISLGLVTAGILALKHTAGIYNAWAVGLALILAARARDDAAERTGLVRVLPPAFILAIVVSLPVLFGNLTRASLRSFAVFGAPIAVAVALVLSGMVGAGRRTLGRAGADLAGFALGALVPTAMWVAYFAHAAGAHVLLQRLILDGPHVARSYSIAFPAPGALALGAGVLVAVTLAIRTAIRRGRLTRVGGARLLLATGATIGLVGLFPALLLVRQSLRMDDWEVAVMHAGRGIDNLAFYLVPVIAYSFLPALRRFVRRDGPLDPVLVCWIHAICQLLLIYPRLDVAHLYEGTVTLLLVGTVVLERTLRALGSGTRAPRGLAGAVAVALALVVSVKVIPRVRAQVGWEEGPIIQRRLLVEGPRGGALYTTGAAGAWIAELNRTVALVRERTATGEPIFAYPALPAMYFLTGRDNPTHLDYFYSGFGEGGDELQAVETLEREQVRYVVWIGDATYDPPDRGFFPILRDYLRRNYIQVNFVGPFRILERVRL